MLPWAPPPRGYSRHLTVGTTLHLQSEPARRLLVGQKENSLPRKTQRASSCTQALIPVQNDISRAKAMSVYLYSGSTYRSLNVTPLIASPFAPDILNVLPIAGLAAATAQPTAQSQSSISQRYTIAFASPQKPTLI